MSNVTDTISLGQEIVTNHTLHIGHPHEVVSNHHNITNREVVLHQLKSFLLHRFRSSSYMVSENELIFSFSFLVILITIT